MKAILDSRCRQILNFLINQERMIPISEIAIALQIPRRTVYYDLYKINEWLETVGLNAIQLKGTQGVLLDDLQKERIRAELSCLPESTVYVLAPAERIDFCVCLILIPTQVILADHLAHLCQVSRNTILNDLKQAKRILTNYHLNLVYEVATGYSIVGDPIKKRTFFLHHLERILPLLNQDLVRIIDPELVSEELDHLYQIEAALKTKYVVGTLERLAYLLAVLKLSRDKGLLTDRLILEIEQDVANSAEHQLVQTTYPELSDEERLYLTIHLLGARVAIHSPAEKTEPANRLFESLATDMVDFFEQLACINFSAPQGLVGALTSHLKISYYRYKYGIFDINPMLEDIRHKYPHLFEICSEVSTLVSQKLGYPISDGEIGYLTLHFGGHLRMAPAGKAVKRIFIICPNGSSTAQLIKNELEQIIPDSLVIDVLSIKDLPETLNQDDLIVSTVELDPSYHALQVNPILTRQDKRNVFARYHNNQASSNLTGKSVDKLFERLASLIPEENREDVYTAVRQFFVSPKTIIDEIVELNLNLADVLTEDRVTWSDEMVSWQEAIRLAALPLIMDHSISERYVQAMIECVQAHGSYIFLTPDIALAHARPEQGVDQLSLSIYVSQTGVEFPQAKSARMIIVLAPIDQKSHMTILTEILELVRNTKVLGEIFRAEGKTEVYRLIRSSVGQPITALMP